MTVQPNDPVVAAFVAAVNAGDKDHFFALLTLDATMSDDGKDRDLRDWAEREIFAADGHMDVEEATEDGHTLAVTYSNATYGRMNTRWTFTVDGTQISRFETGQA